MGCQIILYGVYQYMFQEFRYTLCSIVVFINSCLLDNSEKKETSNNNNNNSSSNVKRHRRRTTVFNEVQLRTLYLHFTYCNFPDPSMFRIIGHITKLEPQVIKIWFQNERSRQRKRALHFMDEGKVKQWCGEAR